MNFSYGWIRELVPGLTTEPVELERLITTRTAECEGIEPFGAHFAKVAAARVLAVEPLEKGRNKSVLVDVGGGKQARVVCGAPNVRPGMLAAWVPPGTSLGSEVIETAVIDNVASEGMLASGAELGINRDSSGLIELDGLAPGECLRGLKPDWIIEIDNKSLTHRPDLWGHYGMAREVAAITDNKLYDPVDLSLLPSGDAEFKVEIADHSLCARYSALVFENVRVAPSPFWMQARLESVGLNGINNIVDATNYVLAELPQPMHAFDADKLAGGIIFVRRARAGEKLEALNGETYELTEADLVIADAAGPIALAGVIGGANSAISETTTRIVFESANFQATSVRLTSARHRLRTDASMRFEKALDPENTIRGLARAMSLLTEVCPEAQTAGGVIDNRIAAINQEPIALPLSFVIGKLGKRVTEEEVVRILHALGFGVGASYPGLLSVTVPSWRATKDISLKEDLVEEVGRMIGYEQINPVAPRVASTVPPSSPMRAYLRKLRRMIASQGFSEVYNYSFTTAKDAEKFQSQLNEHLIVRNPIASELTHMRRSLLPGLFKNVVSNVRHYSEFRLFEIGNEIHPAREGPLPNEVLHLAAVLYAAHGDERNFFELKRVAECLFPDLELTPAAETRAYEHPARTAMIQWRNAAIGRLFELHPSLLANEGIEGRAVFFDVDLRLPLELSSERHIIYTPLRKYPTSGFDLSVVVNARTPVGELKRQLSAVAGKDLVSIEFIRQYQGAPLAEGQKSVSYHLEAGALDHTLTSEEVARIRQRIVAAMLAAGCEIRGVD